ncbi:MAG: hypothetical protein JW892_05675 [Anaerolineae bacterium]|nr:hypothetical protein [Anaerolineae bacterium]
MRRLLIGTTNPVRLEILRAALAPLPIEIVTLAQLGITATVEEDGASPVANAEKKARAYQALSQLPTFALDGGMTITGLPPERQPGVTVRRIPSITAPTAEDLLAFYERELASLGGNTTATWHVGMALALSSALVVTQQTDFPALMRLGRRGPLRSGAPLDCLLSDPISGKAYSEMHPAERPAVAAYRDFVAQYLDKM